MWSAVGPGGAIAVEDTDFDGLFCDPPNGGFDFHKRMYPRVLEHNGGDARIGRKLYRYFLEAGIPDPGLHLVQSVDAAGEAKSERDRRSVLEQSLQPDPLEERRSGQSGYLTLPGEHGRMILRGFRGEGGSMEPGISPLMVPGATRSRVEAFGLPFLREGKTGHPAWFSWAA